MNAGEIGKSYAVGWGRLAWFFASLVLGPLPTFIIVVADPAAPAAPPSVG